MDSQLWIHNHCHTSSCLTHTYIAQCLIGKRYRTRERSVLEVGLSKDVLLMVKRVFRRLQGKEMRKEKGVGASRAFPERLQQDEATKIKTLI